MPELPPPVNVSPVIKFFRYAFLVTGIVYGAVKLKAFQAYEASRADEKARKKIERDARLVEEKRLAAEKDFQQILEIFRPPPKAESFRNVTETDIVETPVVTSSELKFNEKGLTPECDSSYETIYSNGTSEFEQDDIYSKPLDLTVDDFPIGDDLDKSVEDQKCELDAGYVIQDFSNNLPVLPPEEEFPRMPSEK